MSRIACWIAAAAVAVGVLLGGPAQAADGSVPAEVRGYVEDGSLVARLADLYGPDAAGNGIDFDDTTTTGAIVRVHVWTAAQLAGEDTDQPIELANEWVVPVSIAATPVGLATIWINPESQRPELAVFDPDPDLATALSAVPDGSALVYDEAGSAWLALADDGTVTPLVPGSTGLSTPVPLDDVALLPPSTSTDRVPHDSGTGLALAIAVIVFLIIVIVAVLGFPWWRRRREAAAGDAATVPTDPPN